MKLLNYFLFVIIACFLCIGCSTDDNDNDSELPVEFTALEASKTYSFIENTITLTIIGEEFTNIEVTSDNSDLTITQINDTNYEVSSLVEARGVISVKLKNGSSSEAKLKSVSFHEHGIKNFESVEGIEINVDKIDKVLDLIGEPDRILNRASGSESWYYFSKGIVLSVQNSNDIVQEATVFAVEWRITIGDDSFEASIYANDINDIWNLSQASLIMDDVISLLDLPDNMVENALGNIKEYVYNEGVIFSFASDDLNNYQGKQVVQIELF